MDEGASTKSGVIKVVFPLFHCPKSISVALIISNLVTLNMLLCLPPHFRFPFHNSQYVSVSFFISIHLECRPIKDLIVIIPCLALTGVGWVGIVR